MKIVAIFILIFITGVFTFGQSTSSHITLATVYSQNEQYYLKTIPYDNESPSLRGKTFVYKSGVDTPIYALNRAFDTVNKNSNDLILSNNGEVIFYVVDFFPNDEKDGLKSVNVYKKGEFVKSLTTSEITGCDLKKERCQSVFNKVWDLIDEEKSNAGTRNYKRVFKEGVSEQDKFLADFAIFNIDDIVYLTDSKKQTHLFDLKDGSFIKSLSFTEIYPQIKEKGKFNKVDVKMIESPYNYEFPKMSDGFDTSEKLADYLGMKTAPSFGKDYDLYRIYRFKISGMISRDGSFVIDDLDISDDLPKDKIRIFFETNKFNTGKLLPEFEKYYIEEHFFFKNKSPRLGRQEKITQDKKNREELKQRLVAEKLNNIYIPKDLGDCFIELDKLLSEVDKKEMKSLLKRDDMVQYHMGLGMWMRNNWGLWGGSRLQKYFRDRKIGHPDDMSSVILNYYYDWLNGKKETWKDWEKNPKQEN
jgi:hypothetical protein